MKIRYKTVKGEYIIVLHKYFLSTRKNIPIFLRSDFHRNFLENQQ